MLNHNVDSEVKKKQNGAKHPSPPCRKLCRGWLGAPLNDPLHRDNMSSSPPLISPGLFPVHFSVSWLSTVDLNINMLVWNVGMQHCACREQKVGSGLLIICVFVHLQFITAYTLCLVNMILCLHPRHLSAEIIRGCPISTLYIIKGLIEWCCSIIFHVYNAVFTSGTFTLSEASLDCLLPNWWCVKGRRSLL